MIHDEYACRKMARRQYKKRGTSASALGHNGVPNLSIVTRKTDLRTEDISVQCPLFLILSCKFFNKLL